MMFVEDVGTQEEEGTVTLTQVFERNPLEMFDRWINERGVIDARKVGSKYLDLVLAKAWGRTIRT